MGLIVAALCIFLASCIRFFFRDIAWKSVKARNERMGLESKRSAGWENNNAAMGCVGILGSLLLAGVGIALIGNTSTPSPESMQGIVNGTRMYPNAPRQFSTSGTMILHVPNGMSDWSWIDIPWKGSDAPYIAIRKEIDTEIANGTSRNELIRKTGNAFIKNLHDPELAFRWAYTYYGKSAFDETYDRKLAHQICFALIWAIRNKPVSYEYARMQFLITKAWVPQTQLIDLGERLIKENPSDEIVKFNLSELLAYGNQSQKEHAKEYAEYFTHHYPQSYHSHALSATIYLVESKFGKGNQMLADKAIKESKIALSYLPNTPKYKEQWHDMRLLPLRIKMNRKQGK